MQGKKCAIVRPIHASSSQTKFDLISSNGLGDGIMDTILFLTPKHPKSQPKGMTQAKEKNPV